MDKTKEDILQVKSVKEVLLWMQKHPEQADETIARPRFPSNDFYKK